MISVIFVPVCIISEIYTFENSLLLLNTLYMGVWRQVAEYLFIKKKDPDREDSSWTKYMHGINRISILLFLFAIIVMIIRFVKSC